VFHRIEMIVFAPVCHHFESIQRVASIVFVAQNVDAKVVVEFASYRKQQVVGKHKLSEFEIWLNWFQRVLLLSIELYGNF